MSLIKQIIVWVIVLVVAMYIFSYISNPRTKMKATVLFENVNTKVKQMSANIPNTTEYKAAEKIDYCIDQAEKLIPDYLVVTNRQDNRFEYINFEWKDGSELKLYTPYFFPSKGSHQGQNINLYYPYQTFEYSKKIINESGDVLGTRRFIFQPHALDEIEINIEFDSEINIEEKTLLVRWKGYDDELKQLLNKQELSFFVYNVISFGIPNSALCEWDSSSESGEYLCDVSDMRGISVDFLTSPELSNSHLFKIVDYSITGCVWV